MMACPINGAIAGTMMNTIMTNDMIFAISRPLNRSRMIAIDTTRAAATEMPCSTLATSKVSSELAK
ncbi:MAG: hypothetical protein ACD_54C00867G0002 [uncultured bacterium]|nr:MAG: hypothetical protein ACD_54C00867G0002 [uncultured bacterium]